MTQLRVRPPLRKTAPSVDRFAASYIGTLPVGGRIHEEHLADAIRREFSLGPFPKDRGLLRLARELEITTVPLPTNAPMDGTNTYHEATGPMIHLRDDLSRRRFETTFGHELREVLENAFARVDVRGGYTLTHDNHKMNPTSDRFAGYLLMETSSSRSLFRALGFDPVSFAASTQRSLSSVIVRLRTLFPAGVDGSAPVAGFWLFEPPFVPNRHAAPRLTEFRVRHTAAANGFSTAKGKVRSRALAQLLPMSHSPATASEPATAAFESRRPVARAIGALDLFGEESYVILCESGDWHIVLAAIRTDSLPLVQPWLARLRAAGMDA